MLRIGSVRLPLLATIGTTGTLRCPHGLPGACAAPRALWLLVLAVIAAGSQPIAADTTTFVPATFGKYESKFVRSIRFPKGDTPVDIRLLCDATLHNDGRGRGLFCEGRDDHPEFHKAVTRHKARYLRVVIPRTDGRKQTVRFQFNVHFVRDADGERITLAPNHRHSMARYGDTYSSPQRYEGPYRATTHCDLVFDVRVRGVVPADGGGARDVEIVESEANPSCVEAILGYFARSDYIPGFADGKPVEMVLIERFWRTPSRSRK